MITGQICEEERNARKKEFVAKSYNSNFCSIECSKEHKRRYASEYRRKYLTKKLVNRELVTKTKSKAKKTKETKVFEDRLEQEVHDLKQLNIQRKQEGKRVLTYGYYKAYKKLGLIK